MEVAHIESLDRARGTQIGIAYELRWELDRDQVHVEIVGQSEQEFSLGDTDFFDVLASPFFNSLPVARDGLLTGSEAREYLMTFISFPPLGARKSTQRYTPLGNRTVHYSQADFEADIEFDEDGFVTLYHGYIERIA
jgi:hypothetical protein